MALSLGLKVAWLALTVVGVLGCWAVLFTLAFGVSRLGSGRAWAPLVCAAGVTLLEGIFALGFIWRIEPQSMPLDFCIFQVIGFGVSSFFMAGLLAALTTATSTYIAKPKLWSTIETSGVLRWRTYYLLPLLVFPLLATIVQATFVVSFADFDLAGGLACAPRPLWLRFLSYAGPPLLVSLPSAGFTIRSVARVLTTHAHIRRARRSVNFGNIDKFTVRPTRKAQFKVRSPTSVGSPPPRSPSPSASPSPRSPGIAIAVTAPSPSQTSSILRATSPPIQKRNLRTFHLPFTPTPPGPGPFRDSWDSESFETVSSVSFAATSDAQTRLKGTASGKGDTIQTTTATLVGTVTGTALGTGTWPTNGKAARGLRSRSRSRSPMPQLSSIFAAAQSQTRTRARAATQSSGGSWGQHYEDNLNSDDEDDMHTPLRSSSARGDSIRTVPRSNFVPTPPSVRVSPTQIGKALRGAGSGWESSEADPGSDVSRIPPSELPDVETAKSAPSLDLSATSQLGYVGFHPPAKLPRLIWSLLAFQSLLVAASVLAVITPLVDVAQQGSDQPAELGTQQFALLIVAWAPVLCFGPVVFGYFVRGPGRPTENGR
ncbi:Fungal-trans domain-containing protein [Mycena chlorophos]|uniref:Fungal-trans domain-containing protein n=1 Tax=Mycena chlorophos TaxID=658473 RepID=A0A8H6TP41_MYCCL|nr:Fungal-trans domain-containing protein [Mycena chlorophos]